MTSPLTVGSRVGHWSGAHSASVKRGGPLRTISTFAENTCRFVDVGRGGEQRKGAPPEGGAQSGGFDGPIGNTGPQQHTIRERLPSGLRPRGRGCERTIDPQQRRDELEKLIAQMKDYSEVHNCASCRLRSETALFGSCLPEKIDEKAHRAT